MKNEQGFIYPLTLVISLVLMFILVTELTSYKSDLRFLNEREAFEQLQSQLQMAAIDMASKIDATDLNTPFKQMEGTFTYPSGYVEYVASTYVDQIIKISLKSFLAQGRKYNVLLLYDRENNVITRWVEG